MNASEHDQLRAQVSAYFDGEIDPADEAAVVAHLGECDECQALLGDAVGLDAAVKRAPVAAVAERVEGARVVGEAVDGARTDGARTDGARVADGVRTPDKARVADVIPFRPRRAPRATVVIGGVLAAAAVAAIAWRVTRPATRPGAEVKVALADRRAVEVRFGGGPFAAHRPYEVDRSGARTEAVPLAVLAELERRADPATFAAALAVTGDVGRAAQVLATMPDTPAVLADRAAVALLSGDAARALDLIDRARAAGLPAAAWNRALALRDLGYPLAAAAAFDEAAREGGAWGEEAAARAKSLRDDHARRRAAIADVIARGAAMVAGTGAPLGAADVATSPTRSRIAFHDALRVAGDAAALDALVPLAQALDDASPPDERTARAAIDRARAGDLAVRARFADRYRAVVARTATPDQLASLRRDLAAAGPAAADLLVGVTALTATGAERLATLERLLAGATDPWFTRLLALERMAALAAAPDRAETIAREALRGCGPDRADFRCAQLERALAELVVARGGFDEGVALMERAVDHLRRAGEPTFEDFALGRAADLRRARMDLAVARAAYEERLARATDATPCLEIRQLRSGVAEVVRYQRDVAAVRAALPAVDACGAPPNRVELLLVVDLALDTGDAADRARAEAWIEAARPTLGPLARVSEARLWSDADPARARAILAETIDAPEVRTTPGWSTYAHRTVARAASHTGDWAAILDDAAAESGRPAGRCTVVVSPDDWLVVVAARGAAGQVAGARIASDDVAARDLALPAAVRDALAGCTSIAAIARPPMHGRGALLPPELPWAFATGPHPAPAAAAPRTVIVGDPSPPRDAVQLPRLAAVDVPPGAVAVTGGAATPSRVLAELATATYAELHAHGVANSATPGSSYLALSPDADGTWQLTAAAVAQARLAGAPVVVLGACRAASTSPRWDARWSLPDAFLAAGARAVVAADVDLPDREAAALFARLRARLDAGEAPAAALAAERAAAIAAGQAWAARLMLFE